MSRWLGWTLAPLMVAGVMLMLMSACAPSLTRNNQSAGQALCLPHLVSPPQQEVKQVKKWYAYTSTKGAYTACFPGKPREEQNVLDAEGSEQTFLVMVIYEDSNQGKVYATSHSKLPLQEAANADIAQRLNDAQKGIAEGAGACWEQQQVISQSGYEGRQIVLRKTDDQKVIDKDTGACSLLQKAGSQVSKDISLNGPRKIGRPFAKARILYVNDLLYQIFVISDEIDTPDVTAFLNSVQLQPNPAP